MKWYKRDADEHEKLHVVELAQRHGLQGLFFWDHLMDLLTKNFNFWCPGYYKFRTKIFNIYFQPYIKDPRTIKLMLNYLNDEKIILSSVDKRFLYLYYDDIIEKADRYTKARMKDAENRKQEMPKSAWNLTFECTRHARKIASKGLPHANKYPENKGVNY